MRFHVSLALLMVISATSADAAKIKGTVVDQNGMPVAHMVVEATPLDMGTSGGLPRTITDETGHFALTVVSGRTSEGRPYGQRWAIYPHSDKGGGYYPDLSSRFYKTDKSYAEHVTLTEEKPEAEVQIRLGPKAGALTGHVTDSRTGATLMPEFEFAWASEPSNRMGIRMRDPYRILLPADTDVRLVVQCEGHESWIYPGVINIGSGQDMKLDIKLEPLSLIR